MANGEVLAIRLQPRLRARVVGRTFNVSLPTITTQAPIPLMRSLRSDQPRTVGFDTTSLLELLRDPAGHLVVGPPPPAYPFLTVESWQMRWGVVTQETSRVLGTAVLRNESDVPLVLQGLRLALDMNEVPVVPEAEAVPQAVVLPPGEAVPVHLEVSIANARLVEWLTSHLREGERTTVTSRMGLRLVLPEDSLRHLMEQSPVPLPPGFRVQDMELPLLAVPGLRCTVTTDIMGTANHHIARALGQTPVGAEPQPYAVECAGPLGP